MEHHLKLFYEGTLVRCQAERDETLTELRQLITDIDNARAAQADLTVAFAEQERAIANKRKAMGAGDLMPADVEFLAGALRALLIAQRAARVDLLKAEDEISLMERRKGLVQRRLDRLGAELNRIKARVADAQTRAARHDAWAGGMEAGGAVADVKAKTPALLAAIADGAVADPENDPPEVLLIAAAKVRVNADIPEALREHGRLRGAYVDAYRDRRRAQSTQLAQDLAGRQAADFGVTGAVALAQHTFEEAEQAYAAIAAAGLSRYDQALTLLNSVVSRPALTTAESDRIAAVALAADAEALIRERARDDAQRAVADKIVEIENARTAALLADVDADPEADATVQDKRNELSALEQALSDAQSAFESAMQDALGAPEALDLWEGAVPDPIWASLANYDRAVALLTELHDADVGALAGAMSSAEAALAAALAAEDEALRLREQLMERAALAGERVDDLDTGHARHRLAAVRGDGSYHISLAQGEML